MKAVLQLTGFITIFVLASTARAAVCAGAPVVAAVQAPQVEWLRAYRYAFNSPVRLAIDTAGSVYVADPRKGEVLVRSVDGRVMQHRRGLGRPGAIALDAASNIYLADLDTGLVSVYDAGWQFSHRFDGPGLQQAGDIAIDDSRSRIYISDSQAHKVRVYSTAGALLFEFGNQGDGDAQFQYPSGVFYDAVNDEVLVSDQLGYRVQVFDPDGAYKYCIGGSSANPGSFFQGGRLLAAPQGLWADAQGRIYVADSFQGRIKVIDRNGGLLAEIGAFGQSGGALRIPSDVVVDRFGRLFVASANNARVEIFGIDAFTDPEQFTPALVSIEPVRVLEGSSGLLKVLFTVPGSRLADVPRDSIRLNGLAPMSVQTVDLDNDAETELLAMFDLAAVLATLPSSGTARLQLQAVAGSLLVDGAATLDIIATSVDTDQDGIDDDADICPETEPGSIVDAAGCALAQYCACGDFNKHGAYVKCVVRTSRWFVLDGLMDKRSRKQVIREAARSDCGKGKRRAGKRHDDEGGDRDDSEDHDDHDDDREKGRHGRDDDDDDENDKRDRHGRYRR